jgi:hypothetical protein
MKKILLPAVVFALLLLAACSRSSTTNPNNSNSYNKGYWTVNGSRLPALISINPPANMIRYNCDTAGGEVGDVAIIFASSVPTVSGVYTLSSVAGPQTAKFGVNVSVGSSSVGSYMSSRSTIGTVNIAIDSLGKMTITIPPTWIYGINTTPVTDSILVSASLLYP